jgi:hypothetical protein
MKIPALGIILGILAALFIGNVWAHDKGQLVLAELGHSPFQNRPRGGVERRRE